MGNAENSLAKRRNLCYVEGINSTGGIYMLFGDQSLAVAADTAIDATEFKDWLEKVNAEGFRPEDRMNKIWEDDELPVERVLFWEDLNVNLAEIKQ